MEAAKGPGEIRVRHTEFISTEDGQEFIQRLEGLPSEILARLGWATPSQVDHLLAIIRPDRTASVYINELNLAVEPRVSRPMQEGEPVFKNDIIDITRLDFGEVTVPTGTGIAFVFSVGWRKGYFYDLAPLRPGGEPRSFDLSAVLGQLYAQVLFQERFSILDSEWDSLFKAKWFPFVGLSNETITEMLAHLRSGWDVDELITGIVEEVKGKLPSFLNLWKGHQAFAAHIPIFEKAVERFEEGDYVSCTALVFPRIEGIMRAHHASVGAAGKPSQDNLSTSAVRASLNRVRCPLMPHRFEHYLRDVYFSSFDPKDTKIEVSRNSVGHGVADPAAFSDKAAVIGLLVVQHLYYCFEPPSSASALEVGSAVEGGREGDVEPSNQTPNPAAELAEHGPAPA
jgi:hypothetical protein